MERDWKKLVKVFLHAVKVAKKKLKGKSPILVCNEWTFTVYARQGRDRPVTKLATV